MQTTLSFSHSIAGLATTGVHGQLPAHNRLSNGPQVQCDYPGEDCPASAPKLILVPLALPCGSFTTLAIARKLAAESSAKLVLLHVVQLNIAGEERGIPRLRLLDELCRNAEIQLRELAGRVGGDATVEILVCAGRPAEAIVESARRLGADSIVMSWHRPGPWLRWLHRNTVLNVLRQAPCRICLASPGEHAETVNLMVLDHTGTNRRSLRVPFHERQNPFRWLLRTPSF